MSPSERPLPHPVCSLVNVSQALVFFALHLFFAMTSLRLVFPREGNFHEVGAILLLSTVSPPPSTVAGSAIHLLDELQEGISSTGGRRPQRWLSCSTVACTEPLRCGCPGQLGHSHCSGTPNPHKSRCHVQVGTRDEESIGKTSQSWRTCNDCPDTSLFMLYFQSSPFSSPPSYCCSLVFTH